MRPRLTYSNVVATLALFFALTGGAIAARHYLINSTSQINPKVLKTLRGATGATGKEGLAGKNGTDGKEGPKGEPGPLLTTLPSGKTETGRFGFAGTRSTGYVPGVVTSYPIPISFTPAINIVRVKGPSTASCPGSTEKPAAAAGKLCLYSERETGGLEAENNTAPHFGFFTFTETEKGENFQYEGTWALTAP